MSYWFPKSALHKGHFPVWTWLFPPFWLILVPVYAIWLVALALLFLVSIPVNLIRAVTHRGAAPAPFYDAQTGERLR